MEFEGKIFEAYQLYVIAIVPIAECQFTVQTKPFATNLKAIVLSFIIIGLHYDYHC